MSETNNHNRIRTTLAGLTALTFSGMAGSAIDHEPIAAEANPAHVQAYNHAGATAMGHELQAGVEASTSSATSANIGPKTLRMEVPATNPGPPETMLKNYNPDVRATPERVEKIIDENAAYIPALSGGCSGFLIRNSSGKAVGVETAQHCGLLPGVDSDTMYKRDGQYYMMNYSDSPLNVYLGSTPKSLKRAGTISQFVISRESHLVNETPGRDTDLALGVFRGESPQEVIDAYDEMSLTPKQIDNLNSGHEIYNAGWPVNQPDDPVGMTRQTFRMSYLGHVNWTVSTGENLNLAVAATPLTSSGAECSWGNSGSAGFIIQDGKPKLIGTASAFNDFGDLYETNPAAAANEKTYIENTFGVNMDNFAAVCGFSYNRPSASEMVIADVVNVNELIDAPKDSPLMERFTKEFFRPDYKSKVINGVVQIAVPGREPIIIDNPAYDFDPKTNTLILGCFSASKTAEPVLFTESLSGEQALKFLKIIPNKQETKASLTESKGAITVAADGESFIDQHGLVIGMALPPFQDSTFRSLATLKIENDNLVLQEPDKTVR